MDKLQLTGQNLGRVFNYRCVRASIYMSFMHIFKTASLIVENSAETSFRFSPVSFRAPHYDRKKFAGKAGAYPSEAPFRCSTLR
jgi:hypothetical protein